MNSNIDEKCPVVFNEIKMGKKHRFIIYKVESEKVVLFALYRLSKVWDREKRIGITSSRLCPIRNPECASSIWSSPIATACTAADYFSVIGCLMELL